jgi:hypothetical protein
VKTPSVSLKQMAVGIEPAGTSIWPTWPDKLCLAISEGSRASVEELGRWFDDYADGF